MDDEIDLDVESSHRVTLQTSKRRGLDMWLVKRGVAQNEEQSRLLLIVFVVLLCVATVIVIVYDKKGGPIDDTLPEDNPDLLSHGF